jgi:hypothetical protein
MLTLNDVKDRLKYLDEVTLLEILDISSEDLVDRFTDLIENNFEDLAYELADEDYDNVD